MAMRGHRPKPGRLKLHAASSTGFASEENLPGGKRKRLQDRINQLIRAYRMRGHIIAQVHPIGHRRRCRRNSI